MQAIQRVRCLQEGERYWAAYAGEYIDLDGKEYFLSNPEANTVAALYNLCSAELQFEFFCYAYLWNNTDLTVRLRDNDYEPAFRRYMKLREKFDCPWNQQAKHIFPIKPFEYDHAFTEDGDLDIEAMKKFFDLYTKNEFVLYRHAIYDDPRYSRIIGRLSPLKSDLKD